MTGAWTKECVRWTHPPSGQAFVEIQNCPLEELGEYDVIISPANSYGRMDGGFDAVLSQRFPDLQQCVRQELSDQRGGYLAPGQAILAPTNDVAHPLCVVAPTMRLPSVIVPREDIVVYDAMWSILHCLSNHVKAGNSISRVAIPGLGTGAGGVSHARAASLMEMAYRHWRIGIPAARKHAWGLWQ